MAPHSSVLAWRIPGAAEPGGLPSMGSCRDRHDWSDLAAAAAAAMEICVISLGKLKRSRTAVNSCILPSYLQNDPPVLAWSIIKDYRALSAFPLLPFRALGAFPLLPFRCHHTRGTLPLGLRSRRLDPWPDPPGPCLLALFTHLQFQLCCYCLHLHLSAAGPRTPEPSHMKGGAKQPGDFTPPPSPPWPMAKDWPVWECRSPALAALGGGGGKQKAPPENRLSLQPHLKHHLNKDEGASSLSLTGFFRGTVP